jgi:hypothetical protein
MERCSFTFIDTVTTGSQPSAIDVHMNFPAACLYHVLPAYSKKAAKSTGNLTGNQLGKTTPGSYSSGSPERFSTYREGRASRHGMDHQTDDYEIIVFTASVVYL